jgi:ankyrin repeat protein
VIPEAIHSLIRIDSFIRLGELRILFEAVESRTSAVASLAHECSAESAKHALKFISWCISERRDAILSSVISLAGRLDARVAEGAFLRALRALEELDGIDSRGGSGRGSRAKLRSTIIRRLFHIYLARNDIPEAEYWLRRLEMLPNDSKHEAPSLTARQLANSLQRTSKMAQAVLDDLELDQDIRAKLRFSKFASFPAIHRAIRAGHVKSAQILSNAPTALRKLDLIGRTALHIAAETGQVKSLGVQFAPDAINDRDAFQCTPLFLAACNGNFESFAHLVERGADTKARTSGGRSVLAAACSAGHLEIVQYLLQKGIDPNDNPPWASSPLFEAASHGHSEICKNLLEKGAFTDCFANPHISTLSTTADNASKEISEMIQIATNNKTVRPSRHLLASEDNFGALSDLPSSIPPAQLMFSELSSMLANSTAADHEAGTCDSEDSGFYDGLSCTGFGVPELSMCEDIWQQADFLCGIREMEFGTMQNPLEIPE